MEFRKKTTATLLIATFMISAFTFAVIADPNDYFFTQDANGEAGLVSGIGLGHTGDYAVRLYIPGTPDINDDGKVRIPYTGTLASLTTFSFWTKVVGTDGELHPYGSINIDIDDNLETCEYVIVQWEVGGYPPTGADTWIQTVWGAGTRIHVVSATTGLELPGFGQTDAKTLGDLKAVSGWLDYNVLQVKVAVGMWAVTYPLEGFVDDVIVNDVTYTFEPGSSTSITGTAIQPTVSISVTPTSIEIGEVVLGKITEVLDVTIDNTGETDISLTAELYSDDGFYAASLYLDGVLVMNWGPTAMAEAAVDIVVDLTLNVDRSAVPGVHTATLVFWAEEATP